MFVPTDQLKHESEKSGESNTFSMTILERDSIVFEGETVRITMLNGFFALFMHLNSDKKKKKKGRKRRRKRKERRMNS